MSGDERNFDDDIAKLRDRLSSSSDENSCSDEDSNSRDTINQPSNDLILKLDKALQHNELLQQRLDELEQMYTSYINRAKADMKRNYALIKSAQAARSNEKINSFRQFGIPYFKDGKNFCYPKNADTLRRTRLKDIFFPMLHFPRVWKDSEKVVLEKVIKSMEVNRQSEDLKLKLQGVEAKLRSASESEVKYLKSEIDHFKGSISELVNKPLDELIQNSETEYDWETVATHFHDSHSPNECRSMWFNYLHPKINRREWLIDEDEKLELCATNNDFQDWDAIASDLETNRSPLQCMCRYQRFLNVKFFKASWTTATNKRLIQTVENFQIGDYIPWTKVAYNLPSYTTTQLISHWKSINPINVKGKFSENEDLFLIASIRKYGKDFKTISSFFPRRTSVQLSNRYKALMRRKLQVKKWSSEEDQILLEKYNLFGNNWSMISTFFINRSRIQVRQRYTVIQNWIKKGNYAKFGHFPAARSMPKAEVVEKVWEKAVNCIKKTRIKSEKDSITENDLEDIAFTQLKRKLNYVPRIRKVRKKKIYAPLEKQYNDIFRCCYAQEGGRLKTMFTEEELQQACATMFHFQSYFCSNLSLPSASEIDTDKMLMPIDRLILKEFKYLNKSNGKCKLDLKCLPCFNSQTDNILDTEVVNDIVFNSKKNINHLVLPPNHTILVGFRTYLLCRRYFSSVLENKPKDCEESPSQSLCISGSGDEVAEWEKSEHFINSSNLWMKRIQSLFMWPTTMASQGPGTSFQ